MSERSRPKLRWVSPKPRWVSIIQSQMPHRGPFLRTVSGEVCSKREHAVSRTTFVTFVTFVIFVHLYRLECVFSDFSTF